MELKISGLTKKFGAKTAVKDLNITLTNGVYGLLGDNGAGKTTLMRMIGNIQTPDSGAVLLNGRNIAELGEDYRNLLGYLPQRFGFYPDFTALDFLLYGAALKGLPEEVAQKRSKWLLEEVGLGAESKHKIRTFSGGMKQRLGIAQALINNPRILILDEPTVGIDAGERGRFYELIGEFTPDCIVLWATHIVSDMECFTKEIMLESGQIVYFGQPRKILAGGMEK